MNNKNNSIQSDNTTLDENCSNQISFHSPGDSSVSFFFIRNVVAVSNFVNKRELKLSPFLRRFSWFHIHLGFLFNGFVFEESLTTANRNKSNHKLITTVNLPRCHRQRP